MSAAREASPHEDGLRTFYVDGETKKKNTTGFFFSEQYHPAVDTSKTDHQLVDPSASHNPADKATDDRLTMDMFHAEVWHAPPGSLPKTSEPGDTNENTRDTQGSGASFFHTGAIGPSIASEGEKIPVQAKAAGALGRIQRMVDRSAISLSQSAGALQASVSRLNISELFTKTPQPLEEGRRRRRVHRCREGSTQARQLGTHR